MSETNTSVTAPADTATQPASTAAGSSASSGIDRDEVTVASFAVGGTKTPEQQFEAYKAAKGIKSSAKGETPAETTSEAKAQPAKVEKGSTGTETESASKDTAKAATTDTDVKDAKAEVEGKADEKSKAAPADTDRDALLKDLLEKAQKGETHPLLESYVESRSQKAIAKATERVEKKTEAQIDEAALTRMQETLARLEKQDPDAENSLLGQAISELRSKVENFTLSKTIKEKGLKTPEEVAEEVTTATRTALVAKWTDHVASFGLPGDFEAFNKVKAEDGVRGLNAVAIEHTEDAVLVEAIKKNKVFKDAVAELTKKLEDVTSAAQLSDLSKAANNGQKTEVAGRVALDDMSDEQVERAYHVNSTDPRVAARYREVARRRNWV